jgi:ElaA protein
MPPEHSNAHWQCLPFADLTVAALQQIHAARQIVFVVEQHCPYLDADGLDEKAWHLAAWGPTQRLPLAYARLFPPGAKYAEASIGRVLTTEAVRGQGWGRELVRRALSHTEALFGACPVRISAQAHLQNFYAGFGFRAVSEPYLEEDIPHVEMLRG